MRSRALLVLALVASGCDGILLGATDAAPPAIDGAAAVCRDPADPACRRCLSMNPEPLAQERWADCQASPACKAALTPLTCCLQAAGSNRQARETCASQLAVECDCVEGFNLGYSFRDFCATECQLP